MRIEIDITKSVTENAQAYFEKAKKLKRKIPGVKEAIEKAKKQLELETLKKDKADESYTIKLTDKKTVKKEWYEKFRWFYSSEGFLCIGGRDATTNEIIIKKYTDSDDIVFHTDMAGSPFFVVKSEKKDIGKQTLREAADAVVSFSRAWKLGLSNSDVFYVKPEQLSKDPNPGEFLPKGAFVIRGKTNYVDNSINLAVGNYKGKVMAGPKEAVKKHCDKYVILVQGKGKASAAAKKIRSVIGGEIDDIIRALPSGGVDISK